MQTEMSWDLTAAEDLLPAGQAPIETSDTRRMLSFCELALSSLPVTGYGVMGVVTAGPGCGKTVASRLCADTLVSQSQTALPSALMIKVAHQSSTIALAQKVRDQLGEKGGGRRGYELADKAANGLVANNRPLIIVDEADRLTRETYELLRHLFDQTWCPIMLVGLPEIWSIITSQEKFKRRTIIEMKFQNLSTPEILDTFLPQLTLKHWAFDPKRAADRALGHRLWAHVGPSLGDLRGVLQVASMIADHYGEPQITPKIIEHALKYSPLGPAIKQLKLTEQSSDPSRKHEELSERRHRAKDKPKPP